MTWRLQETQFQTTDDKGFSREKKNEVFTEFWIKSQISVIPQERSTLMEALSTVSYLRAAAEEVHRRWRRPLIVAGLINETVRCLQRQTKNLPLLNHQWPSTWWLSWRQVILGLGAWQIRSSLRKGRPFICLINSELLSISSRQKRKWD